MKKQTKLLLIIAIFMVIMSISSCVCALTATLELSDEFKEYLNLSEEEQSKLLMPRSYEITKSTVNISNPFKLVRSYANSQDESFSLLDVIKENLVIKDQNPTGCCWAFATLSALETNLALRNDKSTVYDFSEAHMEYATYRNFTDGTNTKGFDRKLNVGGTFDIAIAYLTNGMGAVDEEDMPFDTYRDMIVQGTQISLNNINIPATSEIYDTKEFESYGSDDDKTEIINEMKDYIKTYGALYTKIHGTGLNDGCYNPLTGAWYCDSDSCTADHAVTIVGWDDTYSKDNFKKTPSQDGAWIVRNSWGDKIITSNTMDELKQVLFDKLASNEGWTSVSDITDEYAMAYWGNYGYTFEKNTETGELEIYFKFGMDDAPRIYVYVI